MRYEVSDHPHPVSLIGASKGVLVSGGLGLGGGVVTGWMLANWRALPVIADNGWGTALLWLAGLLALFWWLAPGRAPLALARIGAAFWISAVLGYYLYYVAQLAFGAGLQGAALDLSQPGAYRVLWYLFKGSVAQWLLLALVGGAGLGWLWGRFMPRRPTVRNTNP